MPAEAAVTLHWCTSCARSLRIASRMMYSPGVEWLMIIVASIFMKKMLSRPDVRQDEPRSVRWPYASSKSSMTLPKGSTQMICLRPWVSRISFLNSTP